MLSRPPHFRRSPDSPPPRAAQWSPARRAAFLRRQQWLLGILGALVVATASALGWLDRLELPTLDWRARNFDRFAPERSDEVVIVGIDNDALETIQRWPWHRAYLAEVIRELTRAGAKTIALDVLLDDPQEPRGDIEDDAELAAAIREHGNVVLAANLRAGARPVTKAEARAAERAGQPVPISLESVLSLIHRQPGLLQLPEDQSVREVLTWLHPKESAARGPLWDEAQRALAAARTLVAAAPRDSIAPQGQANWLECDEPVPPLERLARTAAALGDVSLATTDADGVLRRVPLWVEFRGRLWPSLALRAAYAHAAREPASISVGATHTVLNLDDSTRVTIPMTSGLVAGRTADGLLLVSWPRGGLGWLGRANSAGPAHDLPIGFVLEPMLIARAIRANLAEIDRLVAMSGETDRPEAAGYPERAAQLQAISPDDPRWGPLLAAQRQMAEIAAASAREFLEFAGQPDPTTLSESEATTLANYRAIAEGTAALLAECDAGVARIGVARDLIRQRVLGKLCMIGWAATSSAAVADAVATSLREQTPGVYIHAAMAGSILSRYWRVPLPSVAAAACVLALGTLGTWIGVRARVTLGPVLVAVSIGGWFLASGLVLWDALRLVAPVSGPAIGAAASWLLVILHRYLLVDRARRRTEQRFRSYVSPAVVDILVANPQLDSMTPQRRELTVMYTDLAGFTPIAEQLGPEATAALLSRYFAAMTDCLQSTGATLDKYMGDGIMAFWGAPLDDAQHAAHACSTALEMHEALDRLSRAEPAGGTASALHMRIGLATGDLLVGDFGNPPRHSTYTVLGDASILAARLESACRVLGCPTLASARTRELAGDAFLWRPVGRLVVPGRSHPEVVFELVAPAEFATADQKERAALTEEAMAAYARGDFGRARAAFSALVHRFADGALATAYLTEVEKWAGPRADGPCRAGFEGTLVVTDK